MKDHNGFRDRLFHPPLGEWIELGYCRMAVKDKYRIPSERQCRNLPQFIVQGVELCKLHTKMLAEWYGLRVAIDIDAVWKGQWDNCPDAIRKALGRAADTERGE